MPHSQAFGPDLPVGQLALFGGQTREALGNLA
jgi:hypothetical protein